MDTTHITATPEHDSNEPRIPETSPSYRNEINQDPIWIQACQLAAHALHDRIIPIGPFDGIDPETLHLLCWQTDEAYRTDQVLSALIRFLSLQRESGHVPSETQTPAPSYAAVRLEPEWNERMLTPLVATLSACNVYLQQSGDLSFLNTGCHGKPVQQRILMILDLLWGHFLDPETHLFWNDGNVDAYELELTDAAARNHERP